jgi:alkylated DNA repair dioxygenase AlkB
MRFKPYKAEGKIASVILEPGSIYVLRGAARWKYQHSIVAVEKLRYSITFRTLRTKVRST